MQGPVRPQIPAVASVDASQAAKEDARARRAFSPGLDAFGWIFGLRMKPLCAPVVLKAATLPSSVALPLLPSAHPPFAYVDDLSDKGNRCQHFVIRRRETDK